MKCPRCNFVASNKKDLCPRCEFDLRARKRELGIAVLQPGATIEQLIAQQRAHASEASRETPQSPRVEVVEKKQSLPFWKRLFGVKPTAPTPTAKGAEAPSAKNSPAPPPTPPVMPPPAPTLAGPSPTTAGVTAVHYSLPTPPVAEPTSDGDPLLFHLETLEREIARSQQEDSVVHTPDEDGLEFPSALSESSPRTVPIVSAPSQSAFAPPPISPARTFSAGQQLSVEAASPTPLAEGDLQDLISALDQLNDESSPLISNSESDDLFAEPVSGIDASLDEIIHALDELNPEQDLDDIELFETKFNDLAESMGSEIEAARVETEKLADTNYGLGEIFEALQSRPSVEEPLTAEETAELSPETSSDPVTEEDASDAPTLEMEVVTASMEAAAAEQPVEDTAPVVQDLPPEQYLEDSEDLRPSVGTEPLDELSVSEAEPNFASALPSVTPQVLDFGEEDLDFEKTLDEMLGDTVVDVRAVKVEKKAAKAVEPASVVTDDGMEISFELDFDGAETDSPPVVENDPALDPILSELLDSYETLEKGLEHRSIAPEGSTSAPSGEAHDADDTDLPHVAFARKVMNAVPVARRSERFEQLLKKLSFLSEELLDELKAVYDSPVETSTATTHPPVSVEPRVFLESSPTDVGTVEQPSSLNDDLADLSAELNSELAALESEGVTIYAREEDPSPDFGKSASVAAEPMPHAGELSEQSDEIVSAASFEPPAADDQADLHDELETLSELEHRLDLEEHSSGHQSPLDSRELAALESELDQEVAALETEGTSLFHAESVTPEVDTEPADESLAALESELDQEVAALETEGTSLFHVESETAALDAEPVENEDPAIVELEEQLDEEIASLEAEGSTILHVDPEAETIPPTAAEPTADFSALESELDAELSALQAEGTRLVVDQYEFAESMGCPGEPEPCERVAIVEAQPVVEAEPVPYAEPVVETGPVIEAETMAQAEPAVDTEAVFEVEQETDDDASGPEDERAETLPEAVSTGAFLVNDLSRLIDIAADERADDAIPLDTTESQISEDAEVVETEEISLSQLASFFNVPIDSKDDEPDSELFAGLNKPLDGAVNTGTFLLSDFQRIIAAPVENRSGSAVIDPAIWASAEAELSAASLSGEIVLDASALSAFHRSDALDVLFDAAEEDLAHPELGRNRVSAAPASDAKRVENSSLQKALTNFEREERVLSKRRARNGGVDPMAAPQRVEILRAPLFHRLCAATVDLILVLLLSAALTWFGVLPSRLHTIVLSLDTTQLPAVLPYCFRFVGLSYLLWLTMTAVFVSGWGQTIGGHLLKLETVTSKGDVPHLKQAALRGLCHMTTAFSLGLGMLPLLKKSGWALHDTMSCTYVRKQK